MCQNLYKTLNRAWNKKNTNRIRIYELPNMLIYWYENNGMCFISLDTFGLDLEDQAWVNAFKVEVEMKPKPNHSPLTRQSLGLLDHSPFISHRKQNTHWYLPPSPLQLCLRLNGCEEATARTQLTYITTKAFIFQKS